MPVLTNHCGRRVFSLLAGLCLFAGVARGQQAPSPSLPDTVSAPALPPTVPTVPSVPLESPATSKALGPILAGWDNGFFLRSEDKQFNLRITGQIQADYRGYLNDNDHTDIDTFLV